MGHTRVVKWFAKTVKVWNGELVYDERKERKDGSQTTPLYIGMTLTEILRSYLLEHRRVEEGTMFHVWQQTNPDNTKILKVTKTVELSNNPHVFEAFRQLGLNYWNLRGIFKTVKLPFYRK